MINKAILVGNVGRDPEVRSTQSGTRIATFPLATNERRKDESGNWVDSTEWHNIVAWGRTADVVERYVSKGRQLYIEGPIRTRSWETDGVKKYMTEVHALTLKLLGGRGGDGPRESSGGYDSRSGPSDFPDDSDDVPF